MTNFNCHQEIKTDLKTSNYRKIDAVDEDEICSENSESENEAVEKRC